MPKKHIVSIGPYYYAADSVTAATRAVEAISKLSPVEFAVDDSGSFYRPCDAEEESHQRVELKMHQDVRIPPKRKKSKAKSLPAPKRGSILCICEKSYVAPRQSCPHCGRPFSESHARTHDDGDDTPKLRLL
jgi:hypothetical protein